jgi:energy-coupling factor transport system permease protein
MLDLTYRELGSPVHRLGLPGKVALFGMLGVLSLVFSDLLFLGGVIATCVLLSIAGKVGRRAATFLRYFLLFSLLVFSINLVANQTGQEELFSTTIRFYWWRASFRVTLESISSALRMVLRLFALVQVFLVFTLTTKPEAILGAVSRFNSFHGFGTLLALSYRFLPTVALDGVRIRNSLRSRGVRFDDGGRLERARSYASLGLPLVLNSLDRGLQLAEAMESRGYGRGTRTVHTEKASKLQLALAAYLVLAGVGFLALFVTRGVGEASMFLQPHNACLVPVFVFAFILPVVAGVGRE